MEKEKTTLAYCYCYGKEMDIYHFKLDLDLIAGYLYGDGDKSYKEDFMFFFDSKDRILQLTIFAITSRHPDIEIHLVTDDGKYEIHSRGKLYKVNREMEPLEKFYKLI